MRVKRMAVLGFVLAGVLAGCNLTELQTALPAAPVSGETGRVVSVIDGDTIDVEINGVERRVRYLGVNTPERDQVCYSEARSANAALVRGQTVTLVKDTSETDQYGRLLRHIYVGEVWVNEQLVRMGWGETVVYAPDDAHAEAFRALEQQAAAAGLGCHPSGIFADGTYTR